jgi:hypothetical protein
MGFTLSDRTILVNLLTPMGREQGNSFYCDTKALQLLNWAMLDEKL